MKIVKLGNIISLVGGGTPSKDVDAYWNGDIHWASVKDLKSDILISTEDKISKEGAANSSTRSIPAGTLLIATRMAVGNAAIPLIDVAINQDLKAIFCTDEISKKYLFYFLKSQSGYFESVSSGATVQGIKINHILDIQIPLPSLPTQQKIAAILDAADAFRKKTKAIIEKYEMLAQSLFLEMFGDPVKNEKGWEKKNGVEYSNKISVGVVIKPASNYVDEGVIALRSLNVKPNKIDLTDLVFFSKEAHNNELSKSKLNKGDVVIIRTGSTGTAAIIPEELDNINCIDLIIVKPNLKFINPKYLVYFFNSERGKNLVSGHEVGGIQKHFNIGSIKKIEIPTPPIELQNQFAERVAIIEAQKQQAQLELAKSEELFQSLLQRAFNGELS